MTNVRSPRTGAHRIGPAQLALALVLGAVFLFSHPYTGIRHDGILYAGEAIARILPGRFQDDPYFLFGSQGRFTLLPIPYAAAIAAFGLGLGTIVGLLLAFVAYLAATVYLVAWLVPARLRVLCIGSVVLGWTLYGGHRIFAYSEPFFTARSLAEPASLAAIAFVVRRKWTAAAAMLVLAFVLHPLIALGAATIAWIFLVLNDKRWIAPAILAGIAFLAGAASGWLPLADVFTRYDAEWLDYLQEVNTQAFVLRWSVLDYGVVVFDAVVLILAWRCIADVRRRHLLLAAGLAGLGAVLLSTVLVDFAHNPFFGKLQIWRALWLMQWLAMATMPLVVEALWRSGEQGRIAASFIVMGWLAPFTIAPGPVAIMAIAVHTIGRRFVLSAFTTRIVIGVVAIAAGVIALQFELRVWQLGTVTLQPFGDMLGQSLTLGSLLMVALWAWMRLSPRVGRWAPLLALLLFLCAASLWDQRSPWKRELESHRPGVYLWSDVVAPDAKVYWFRDLMAPWVLLGHGNYYTDQQASGAVFSRDMVVELEKRQKLTGLLEFQQQICQMMNNLSRKDSTCEPDAATVQTLCIDGHIDFVVLQSRLKDVVLAASYATGVTENGYEKKFFLYRCSALKTG